MVLLAKSIKGGEWSNPVFFGNNTYNVLLGSYLSAEISLSEFIDTQDYLHLLSDFSSQRPDDNLPIKLPAKHVIRIEMTDQLLSVLSFGQNSIEQVNRFQQKNPDTHLWVTSIELSNEDNHRLEEMKSLWQTCHKEDMMYQRCIIEKTKYSVRDQFLTWVAANIQFCMWITRSIICQSLLTYLLVLKETRLFVPTSSLCTAL